MSDRKLTAGRRVRLNADGYFPEGELLPGDYWQDRDGVWASRLPNGIRCGLRNHQITEHGDGTISVQPSILMTCPGAPEWDWHGYLERGIWREC